VNNPTRAACLLAMAWIATGSGGCAFVSFPAPQARAGRLTTPEGAPIADAEVEVEFWRMGFGVDRPEEDLDVIRTTTDADGRWAVPGRAVTKFLLELPDGAFVLNDRYTFRAPGRPERLTTFDADKDRRLVGDAPPGTPIVTSDDSSSPMAMGLSIIAGGAVGGGQIVCAHAGALAVASRGGVGLGARGAVDVGVHGTGGDLGVVLVPTGGNTPNGGLEAFARAVRPWRAGDLPTSGGGVAGDLWGYRLALTYLRSNTATRPTGDFYVSFGFGYF
jgi:hypothetical protein